MMNKFINVIKDTIKNKANLRGLIDASSQVILLKLDPNPWKRRFLGLCDLQIRQMA